MAFRRLDRRRSVRLAALAGLVAYLVWIGGPYLRSVIVRDAAVTSWINPITSPISGYVGREVLYPGQRVGADGRIATIEDPLADRSQLAGAQAALERAVERQKAAEQLVALRRKVAERRAAFALAYADAFKRDLDTRIAAARGTVALTTSRLDVERRQATRLATLAAAGHGSHAAADAEAQLVLELQKTLTGVQAELDRAGHRRKSAEIGTFLLDDGTDAAIAARGLDDAEVALNQANLDLAVAEVDVGLARKTLKAARQAYGKALSAVLTAPTGALVWSLVVGPGSAVQPGSPVVSWVDCRVMLVDAPVTDVELALLAKGASADVVLEGETRVRHGTVLLTRGSAATLKRIDLAALAKGRQSGVGQVLVKLDPSPTDVETCPIGQAAHVDFPSVGLIDIVRARLRL
jgi:multidrug resistance efflux pump